MLLDVLARASTSAWCAALLLTCAACSGSIPNWERKDWVEYKWPGTTTSAAKGLTDAAGKPVGEWCYWWPNEQIQAYGEFRGGEQRGPWLFWRADGVLWNGKQGEPVPDGKGVTTYFNFVAGPPHPTMPSGSGIYSATGKDLDLTEDEVRALKAKANQWVYAGVPSRCGTCR